MRNPFQKAKSPKKPNPFGEYLMKEKILGEKYAELAEQAGITDKLSRCYEFLLPDFYEDLGSRGTYTRAYWEAEEQKTFIRKHRHRNCVRAAIFDVKDVNLRKAIMSTERKLLDSRIEYWQSQIIDNKKIIGFSGRSDSGKDKYWAGVIGAFIVILGANLGGDIATTLGIMGGQLGGMIEGSVVAAVFVLIFMIVGVSEANRAARQMVRDAVEKICDLEALIDSSEKEEAFTWSEAETGEMKITVDAEDYEGPVTAPKRPPSRDFPIKPPWER
jgi:hypothetical protein